MLLCPTLPLMCCGTLEHSSRVWGSVVGPFSHVAFLLSSVVSSEFKQLVPAHKEHIHILPLHR